MSSIIYKICPASLWHDAVAAGVFKGAPIDLSDGYIHFSRAEQAAETAAKHFGDQHDLLILAIDSARLGPALKYEPSRGGQMFPHLYGPLALDAVLWVKPLPLSPDGKHIFPALDA